jgi:hypothetical protein
VKKICGVEGFYWTAQRAGGESDGGKGKWVVFDGECIRVLPSAGNNALI